MIPSTGENKGRQTRWPVWLALLTSSFLPATTARRTQHVSYRVVFEVFVLSLILAGGVVVGVCSKHMGPLVGMLDQQPIGWLAVPGLLAVAVVAGMLWAFLVAPWGAADEPLSASYGHALRRVWLQGPQWILIAAAASMALRIWYETRVQWRLWASALTGTIDPETLQVTWQSLEKLPAAPPMASFMEAMQFAQNKILHAQCMLEVVLLVLFCWFVWASLRAVGCRRHAPPPARPPMCERCGYNLTGSSQDGRCPECGEPVSNSLGDQLRPGAIWERRAVAGVGSAFLSSCWQPILTPTRFSRTLRVTGMPTAYRWFLVGGLLVGMILAGAWYACIWQVLPDRLIPWARAMRVLSFMAVVGLGGPLLAAGLAGLWYGLVERRNLLPVSMQAAAYAAGALWLWVMLVLLSPGLLNVLDTPGTLLGLPNVFWLVILCGLDLFLPVVYLLAVFRITAWARYANR